MPRYFAELNPTTQVVIRVIVCDSKEWCETNLGGMWVETHKGNAEKKFAGIGMFYHSGLNNFYPSKPYPSWTLDNFCNWKPPLPEPNDLTEQEQQDGYMYQWNETNRNWSKIQDPIYSDPTPTTETTETTETAETTETTETATD